MAKGAGMLAPGAGHDAGRPHHRRRRSPPPRLDAALRTATRAHASTAPTPTAACPPTTRCSCWPAAPPASRRTRTTFTDALTAGVRVAGPATARRRRGRSPRHRGHGDRRRVRGGRPRRGPVRSPGRNLFKCAIFGNDPNWGRVLAVGRHRRRPRSTPIASDVSFNGVTGVPGAASSARTARWSTSPAARWPSSSTCRRRRRRPPSGPTTSPTTTSRRTRSTPHEPHQDPQHRATRARRTPRPAP